LGANGLSDEPDTRNELAKESAIKAGLRSARNGNYKKALPSFSKAVELAPMRWDSRLYRGIARARLGQYDLAIEDLSVAVSLNPRCLECFFERATAEFFIGQFENALNDLSHCLDLYPDFAPAHSMRAGIYVKKGSYDRALADMNAALKLRPNDSGYLHNRAVVLTGLERYGEAIFDYENAIRLNPKGGGTYNNLAWLLATVKDPEFRDCRKAIHYALKALETDKNGAWLDTLAAAYAECGEFEMAMSSEIKAYKISNPPNEIFRKRIKAYKNGINFSDRGSQNPGNQTCQRGRKNENSNWN